MKKKQEIIFGIHAVASLLDHNASSVMQLFVQADRRERNDKRLQGI